ncbi:hypothetical protein V866_005919 [Kwoniella sp. B9012]
MPSEGSRSAEAHTDDRSRAELSGETSEASQSATAEISNDTDDRPRTDNEGATQQDYPTVEPISEPHQAHTRSTDWEDDPFFRDRFRTRFPGPKEERFFGEPRPFGHSGYHPHSSQMHYTPDVGSDDDGGIRPFSVGSGAHIFVTKALPREGDAWVFGFGDSEERQAVRGKKCDKSKAGQEGMNSKSCFTWPSSKARALWL